MGAIERAMALAVTASKCFEESLNRISDAKERQLAISKAINHARDVLERARNDSDGTGAKNFSAEEQAAVIDAARAAGVELTDEDFSKFNSVHAEYEGRAALESAREEDKWDDERNTQLDSVDKRLERALQAAQDETGMIDFKMNLAMNDLSKSMQDAQAVNQIRNTLLNALVPRA